MSTMEAHSPASRQPRAWYRKPAGGVVLLLLVFTTLAVQDPGQRVLAESGNDYAGGGANACLMCHSSDSDHPADNILGTPHGLKADPHSPMGDGQMQCQSCHGPSLDHMGRGPDGVRPPPAVTFSDPETSTQNQIDACTACHDGSSTMHFAASAHRMEEVTCTSCHSVHVDDRDPVMVVDTQPGVCFDCHSAERAELLRPHRHPVQAAGFTSQTGVMSCTDCHAPHGSAGPASLQKATLNETCFDCHAEMRGPFVYEHEPVREDCTNCHQPHGSQHPNLLVQRTPWLCQQCHLADRHPSAVRSGLDVPPAGAHQSVLGQDCANCHTNVHGSNHPSGVRFTR